MGFIEKLKNKSKQTLSNLVLSIRYGLHDAFVAKDSDAISLIFAHKKVVFIGPAEGRTEELDAAVKSADICVLINKGYRVGHFYSLAQEAKEVVLFHCLHEDEDVGGGVLDLSMLAQINVREIIYPLSEKKLYPLYLNAFHKLGNEIKLTSVKKDWYNRIVHQLDGYRPNTGFAALVLLIEANCSNLFINGVTFYRSPYHLDYRDNVPEISDAISLIESGRNHNPDKDFQLFKDLIKGRQNIQISDAMKSIVSAPFKPMFYQ